MLLSVSGCGYFWAIILYILAVAPIFSSARSIYTHHGLMKIFSGIITDRGSKYAVSGGACTSHDEANAFIKDLCRNKKFAKATHNTWAFLHNGQVHKYDDGEKGAGAVIGRMLERENIEGHIIVVTRWYGGKHLGGDRFRHVQDAVRYYVANAL